jgi:hypothetical protein
MPMRIRSLVTAALFAAALGAHAPPAQAAALVTVDASSTVDRVIVYSTRAKVFRRATATLKTGETRVRVATLPTTVNLDSVQVRSKSTKVKRVEVAMARGRLPRQAEAEKLVAQLEALDDKLTVLRDQARVWRDQRTFVRNLYLRQPPQNRKLAQPEGIYVDTWRKTLRWVELRNAQARKRLEELRKQQRKLHKQRHKLVVAARQLDLSAVERPQLTVTATVKGRGGKHTIMVSYLVRSVSWRPSYDLRYDHVKKRVEATYYADVTQRSGEDWKNASMRFSTARAMSLVAVPELPTWTLGRKRDFIPRPRKRYERTPRQWRAPARPVMISAAVRQLRALLGGAPRGGAGEGYGRGGGKSYRGRADSLDDLISAKPRARRPRRISRRRYKSKRRYRPSPKKSMAPRAPPPPARPVARDEAEDRGAVAESIRVSGRRLTRSLAGGSRGRRWRKRPPVERVPWTDVGYRPPYLPANSPAAAAKGYLFTLYAPGRHEVPATGAKRRIPVLRTSFRVSPIYRLLPGKSKLAYVLAELKNTSGRPILRGHANLFAGTMFSGRSYINTALPGHKMSLPLGVDDSVKIVRHLKQRTVTEGVLFKDDVTEYTVEIEIANNRRYPITVDMRDQVPRKSGRKIEIGGFVYKVSGKKKTAAKATKNRKKGWTGADDQGRVVWIGKVGARQVKKLSFSFRITRPKDWLLRQHGG